MSSDYSNPSSTNLLLHPVSTELPSRSEPIDVIAQPYYTSKLRYRSDYTTNKNRRGVLRSRNNPNYRSPTIHIPTAYLNVAEQYFIRVCLVTVVNERTNCRYLHPYDLEDVTVSEYNDRYNNAVWFPIQAEDIGGIKSFPNLRVVKKKADDIKDYGDLRVLDSPTDETAPQLGSTKDTIKEFNLEKAQLAITVGKKISTADDNVSMVLYSSTTIFSDEMIENIGKESDVDHAPTTVRSHLPKASSCCLYKYAPQHGFQHNNEEVLLFFTNKLKPRKYGDLQVTFECERSDARWSAQAFELEVKDQMVSFKTPIFPFLIDDVTPVNIVLQQRKRALESLIYNYIPTGYCANCRRSTTEHSNIVTERGSNKRCRSDLYPDDETTDETTLICATSSLIREQNPPPSETRTFSSTINSVSLPLMDDHTSQLILDTLANSIELLFSQKDYTLILRICRSFIRKRPQLLHIAIDNNYFDLLSKFIPVASIDLLQQTNQLRESALLHALRLNRLDIVKTILEKRNSPKLLDDVNVKQQNILHILAINKDQEEMLELFMDYVVGRSIDIAKKLNDTDEDDHTPLELSIMNNNLSATRHFSKYYNNSICVARNCMVKK